MTTTRNLTKAAQKYLAAMQRGEYVELTYGPYMQLVAAGYITGPQDAPVLLSNE
jgi:hypothetical protein